MNAPQNKGRTRIVVGVDGSEPSKVALRWAARIAGATGADIQAVSAWWWPATYGMAYAPSDWMPEQETRKVLVATVDQVFGSQRPGNLELIVDEGNPAQRLLIRAEGAQMLIVGSRGHGGFVGLLLGSVSANCAEHASCPVLVVHNELAPAVDLPADSDLLISGVSTDGE